jgi:hypothetical protein
MIFYADVFIVVGDFFFFFFLKKNLLSVSIRELFKLDSHQTI